jgi:serine/threonine protein kinase
MEYCGCGDLAQKVERYKRRRQYIDEDVVWRYLIQSLKALTYLHDKGICHRDLKTATSFIAEDGSIKIGDMNVSKRLNQGNLKTQIGTPYYMSPEIWQNRPYNASCDLWSLGCMVYELCALRPPFTGNDFPALKRSVLSGRYSSIPGKYSSLLGKTIGLLLKQDPRGRPSAASLLRSGELASKLPLDGGNDQILSEINRGHQHSLPDLLQTIMVPKNMKKLNAALPKACYPDSRPNTPSAWTVDDQARQIKKANKQLAKEGSSHSIPACQVSGPDKENLRACADKDDASSVDSQSSVQSKGSRSRNQPASVRSSRASSHKQGGGVSRSNKERVLKAANREVDKFHSKAQGARGHRDPTPPASRKQAHAPAAAPSAGGARPRPAVRNNNARPSRLW